MTVGARRSPAAPARRATERGGWRLAAALVALAAIPLVAGALRLLQLLVGSDLMPDDSRFDEFPVALVVHIVAAAVFALVGALQFVPRLQRRGWHRQAGWISLFAGLAVAGSALWLTLFYDAKPGTGGLLFGFRLTFASAMALSVVLGAVAIRRRDIAGHRAWMIRAYAIGLGAGTQVFTGGFAQAVFGTGVLAGDLEKGAAWLINLAIAEWAIGRPVRVRRAAWVGESA